jgi:hypothetical protein
MKKMFSKGNLKVFNTNTEASLYLHTLKFKEIKYSEENFEIKKKVLTFEKVLNKSKVENEFILKLPKPISKELYVNSI